MGFDNQKNEVENIEKSEMSEIQCKDCNKIIGKHEKPRKLVTKKIWLT